MESILTSIKKLLGITEEYDQFDPDIIMHVNSVFMILTQLGVGPAEGFSIEDDTAVWTDFIQDVKKLESVNEWYKVCTEAGIEGFCMKKYVSIHLVDVNPDDEIAQLILK